MATITAGQLRTHGIDGLMEDHLMATDHAVISVKGQKKYVIITIERYEELLSNKPSSDEGIETSTDGVTWAVEPEKIIIETQPSLITKIRDKYFS
jgi:hypothetical protein